MNRYLSFHKLVQEAIFPVDSIFGSLPEKGGGEYSIDSISRKIADRLSKRFVCQVIKYPGYGRVLECTKDSDSFILIPSDENERKSNIVCIFFSFGKSIKPFEEDIKSVISGLGCYLFSSMTHIFIYLPRKIECPNAWICVDKETKHVRLFDVPDGQTFFDSFPVAEFSSEEKRVLTRYMRKERNVTGIFKGLSKISETEWYIISNKLADTGIILLYDNNISKTGSVFKGLVFSVLDFLRENGYYGAPVIAVTNPRPYLFPYFYLFSTNKIRNSNYVDSNLDLFSIVPSEQSSSELSVPVLYENLESSFSQLIQEAILPTREYEKPEEEKGQTRLESFYIVSTILSHLQEEGFQVKEEQEGEIRLVKPPSSSIIIREIAGTDKLEGNALLEIEYEGGESLSSLEYILQKEKLPYLESKRENAFIIYYPVSSRFPNGWLNVKENKFIPIPETSASAYIHKKFTSKLPSEAADSINFYLRYTRRVQETSYYNIIARYGWVLFDNRYVSEGIGIIYLTTESATVSCCKKVYKFLKSNKYLDSIEFIYVVVINKVQIGYPEIFSALMPVSFFEDTIGSSNFTSIVFKERNSLEPSFSRKLHMELYREIPYGAVQRILNSIVA